jgi:MFS family permease
MMPSLIATFLCGLVAAQLGVRIGLRVTIVAGCLIASAGQLVVVMAHEQQWQMYVANGVTGLGTGLVLATLTNAVIRAVPREHTGVVTGMNANIRTIGGSIGVAVMTTIVTTNPLASGYPSERAYVVGFAFLAGAALLAAVAGAMLPTTARGAERGTTPVTVQPEIV